MTSSIETLIKICRNIRFYAPSYYTFIGDTFVRISDRCTDSSEIDEILKRWPELKGSVIVSIVFEPEDNNSREDDSTTKNDVFILEYIFKANQLSDSDIDATIAAIKNIKNIGFVDMTCKSRYREIVPENLSNDFIINRWRLLYNLLDGTKKTMDQLYHDSDGNILFKDVFHTRNTLLSAIYNIIKNEETENVGKIVTSVIDRIVNDDDGSLHFLRLEVSGFSLFGTDKITDPDGNEMDIGAFLASLNVISNAAIEGGENFSSFAAGEAIPFRIITQRYTHNKGVCDANGKMYIELDLTKPVKTADNTVFAYTGINPDVAAKLDAATAFNITWEV